MKNLANVQASIADIICRIELAWGNEIPAYQAVRTMGTDQEMKGSIVGILEYADGQDIVFIRKSDHWVAHLAKPPRGLYAERTTVTVMAGGDVMFEPRQHELRTQDELHEFVRQMSAHGPRRRDNSYAGRRDEPCQLLSIGGFYSEHMSRVAWPETHEESTKLFMLGMRAYGHEINDPKVKADCDWAAIEMSERTFGKADQRTQKIAGELSQFLKQHIELCFEMLGALGHEDPKRLEVLGNLEFWLSKRLQVMQVQGYTRGAGGANARLQLVRVELLSLLIHLRGARLQRLRKLEWRQASGCHLLPHEIPEAVAAADEYVEQIARLCERLDLSGAARLTRNEAELGRDRKTGAEVL
jgi:hypothetical protein